jgi:predicted nuclease of predicted toxin-antitoxin system
LIVAWVDAQLSPSLAPWLASTFEVDAYSVRFLGLRDAKDREIFPAARDAGAVVLTKDRDFVSLLERFGPPPQVVWLSCGNTSNDFLRKLLSRQFSRVLELLSSGEPLVELAG